jgi:transposase
LKSHPLLGKGEGVNRFVNFLPGNSQGGKEMIGFDRWIEVKGLRQRGWSIRKIARELAMDRKTVRRALSQARPQPYRREVKKASILAPYMGFLLRRAPEVDYWARRLFLELKGMGYQGSYNQVKRAVRPWREEKRWLEEATVRFETLPGQQAQVDWASSWAWIGEERRRVHLFTMVLG